ncbi:unnamed protein product [Ambrosiozyma monospora]|uniref:Unnamed protein product n=1 Tax=Ambrosiozyma monospora TaxID=43982 RepID=A0ACB5U8J5_AMBMO|nr:unnamed protein product [Ambrosiozyma monospora]
MMNKTRRSSRLPSRMSTGNLYHLQNGLPSPGPSPQNPQYQQFPPQQQYGNSYYPPQQQFPRGQMPMGVPPPSSRHNSLSSGVSNRMFYFPNGEVFRPRAQSKNGHRQRPPPPRGSRPPTSPSFNQQQFQQFGPAPGQGQVPYPAGDASPAVPGSPAISNAPQVNPEQAQLGPVGPSPPSSNSSTGPEDEQQSDGQIIEGERPIQDQSRQLQPQPQQQQMPMQQQMPYPPQQPHRHRHHHHPQYPPQQQQQYQQYPGYPVAGYNSMPNLRNPNYPPARSHPYMPPPQQQQQFYNNRGPQGQGMMYQNGPQSPVVRGPNGFGPGPFPPQAGNRPPPPQQYPPDMNVMQPPTMPSNGNRVSMTSQNSTSSPSPSMEANNNQDTPASSVDDVSPVSAKGTGPVADGANDGLGKIDENKVVVDQPR